MTDLPPLPVELTRTDAESVVVAAFLGSIAFGIVMSLTLGDVLLTAIPGMYGLAGVSGTTVVAVGWVIHLSHGVALGVGFGLLLTALPRAGLRRSIAAGVAYGAVLWLVLATVLMPLWVGTTTAMSPPVPDVQPWSLLGHAFYGAYLGAIVPLYRQYE